MRVREMGEQESKREYRACRSSLLSPRCPLALLEFMLWPLSLWSPRPKSSRPEAEGGAKPREGIRMQNVAAPDWSSLEPLTLSAH